MWSNINTQKSENQRTVNHGFSFPNSTGKTAPEYHSTSTSNIPPKKLEKVDGSNMYAICSDWVEFLCTWGKNPIALEYVSHTNGEIIVERISVHNNPNFRYLHRIYRKGVEVCDIFSSANNRTHAYNEVSIKVSNSLLYTVNWVDNIQFVVSYFKLAFKRMARWDIALDGQYLLKLDGLLNKYTKSHTVQCSNKAIKVLPMDFNKDDLRWSGWNIGKKKSGISARYYDKTKEISASGKDYVVGFWNVNGIATERVGRFEVQLNGTRLKKYRIDLSNMEMLTNAEYLGTVLRKEVKSWIRFFRVRKKDVLNHKKETAINRGHEIRFIRWNHLPNRIDLLEYNDHTPHASITNARNSISFTLREILKHPNTSTTAQADVIEHYAKEYHLEDYVQHKIRLLFGNGIDSQYLPFLQRFIHTDSDLEETHKGF